MSINGLPPSIPSNYGHNAPENNQVAKHVKGHMDTLNQAQNEQVNLAQAQQIMNELNNYLSQQENTAAITACYQAAGQNASAATDAIDNVTNAMSPITNADASNASLSSEEIGNTLQDTAAALQSIYNTAASNR